MMNSPDNHPCAKRDDGWPTAETHRARIRWIIGNRSLRELSAVEDDHGH